MTMPSFREAAAVLVALLAGYGMASSRQDDSVLLAKVDELQHELLRVRAPLNKSEDSFQQIVKRHSKQGRGILKYQHEFHGTFQDGSEQKYTGYLNETIRGTTGKEQLAVRSGSKAALTYEAVNEWFETVLRSWKFESNYMQAHKTRWIETLLLSSHFVGNGSKVLFLGEYGHMAYLFWRALGVTGIDLVVGTFETSTPQFSVTRDGVVHTGQGTGPQAATEYALGPVVAKKCNIETMTGDCELFTTARGQYDAVVAFEVIEHMERNPMRVVHAAHAALKDGGRFIVTVPNADSYINILKIITHRHPSLYQAYTGCGAGPTQHPREYGINELQQLVIGGGFEVEFHRSFSPYSRHHIDYDDDMMPSLRQKLIRHGMVELMTGYTHFIVSRKVQGKKQYKCVRWLYHDEKVGTFA